MEPHLPEKIIEMLVCSRYAGFVGRTMSTRLDYILEIASLHTKGELLRQQGLGRSTVLRIEKWMEFHGRRFRHADESLDSVICRFEFRKGVAKPGARPPWVGTANSGGDMRRRQGFAASEDVVQSKSPVHEVV